MSIKTPDWLKNYARKHARTIKKQKLAPIGFRISEKEVNKLLKKGIGIWAAKVQVFETQPLERGVKNA